MQSHSKNNSRCIYLYIIRTCYPRIILLNQSVLCTLTCAIVTSRITTKNIAQRNSKIRQSGPNAGPESSWTNLAAGHRVTCRKYRAFALLNHAPGACGLARQNDSPIWVIAVAIGATVAARQLSALPFVSVSVRSVSLAPGFSRRWVRFESEPRSWLGAWLDFPVAAATVGARKRKPPTRPRPFAITLPVVVF